MQIADLTVSNEMPTTQVASPFPAAASDFFRLLEKVMRGDVGAAQTLPPLADHSGVPSSGSVASETLVDPSTEPVVNRVEPLRTAPQEAMTVGGQSGDGRDVTALDQSDIALALTFLAGAVSTAAFERLAEGPWAALTPAGADALDLTALLQFQVPGSAFRVLNVELGTWNSAPSLALADQHPLVAEPQGSVGHSLFPAVMMSAADVISPVPARVAEEPPRGPAEERSVRLAPQGTLEATARPSEAAPLFQVPGSKFRVLNLELGTGNSAPSVVPDAPAELPRDQRLTPAGISAPALSKVEGPALSGSAPLTTGSAEGGYNTPRFSTESAGLPMMALDETANFDDGAAAITVFQDPPDKTATEERPQLPAQPGALRDRLDVGQERLGSGSEGEDGSRGVALPAPGSDRGDGSGPNSGEVSSTRADAPRPGASIVAERDRSLTLQVTQQIVAAARLGRREDGTSVRLRLRPESLGELLIKISWKEKGIVAAIQAESPVTARMLQENLGHLKDALGERGVAVNDLGVQVGVDLRHGRAHDDRFPATTTSWVAQEARPWLQRDEALPLASLIRREGLIDIRV